MPCCYIASDSDLPLINWNESNPGFCVDDKGYGVEEVKDRFSKKKVYYIGSSEGCGCGFAFTEYDPPERAEVVKRDHDKFLEYLTNACEKNHEVEFFSCWSGDEKVPAKEKMKIKLSEFKVDYFNYVDGTPGNNIFLSIAK